MMYDDSKISSCSVHKIHKLHPCILKGISHYSSLQIMFNFSSHYITVTVYHNIQYIKKHFTLQHTKSIQVIEWKSLMLLNIGPTSHHVTLEPVGQTKQMDHIEVNWFKEVDFVYKHTSISPLSHFQNWDDTKQMDYFFYSLWTFKD